MTESDKIIEEIRESRRRMSEDCQHDPAKLIAYLKRIGAKYASQVEDYKRSHSLPPVGTGPR
jgi:hypothetical protein